MNTESSIVCVKSKKEYDRLCDLINHRSFIWGHGHSSFVLVRIDESGAQVITCDVVKNGFSWIQNRAEAHLLKFKYPITLQEFTTLFLAYRLTGDLEIFKC